MIFACFRDTGLYDDFIRLDERGDPYTHVAIYLGDRLLEAYPGSGVRYRPMDQVDASKMDLFQVSMTPEQEALAMAFAEAQLGDPYDWKGIAGVVVGHPDDSYDRWFCSKYCFQVAKVGGVPLLERITCGRVRPYEFSISPILIPITIENAENLFKTPSSSAVGASEMVSAVRTLSGLQNASTAMEKAKESIPGPIFHA